MAEGILIAVIVILAGALLFLILQKNKNQPDSSNFLMIQNQLQDLRKTVDDKLGMSATMFQQQFKQSAHIIQEVTEKLTKLDATNKQVLDFSQQLQNLQDILKNPKQRGILGEYYLETVLKNVLPPNAFQMQYEFKDGTIVDAAVFVKDKIIPIDSKFSLENYNRILESRNPQEKEMLERAFKQDLKGRIDETAKYVKQSEGTMDFAFMFIPAEAVFYDLLMNKVGAVETQDLIEYAIKEKHVIIVSPTSFLAYLQTVLQGLRALQIEESAKEIRKKVEDLGRHIASYEMYMKKVGINLGTTVNSYNTAYKELAKIDKDVLKIEDKGAKSQMDPVVLLKPESEDLEH
ncbi:MAG: DNA recombination protein RmuC [Candidatus Wildermuthbacteria bacterium]|nr:DNA recombination protein RmuC [Candidatus Wildermuthbacteria bacterium]